MRMLEKLFGWLNTLPWTKPFAIVYGAVGLAVFVLAWASGRDIPANATQFGIWFGGAVFALATGKSVIEGRRRPRDEKTVDISGDSDNCNVCSVCVDGEQAMPEAAGAYDQHGCAGGCGDKGCDGGCERNYSGGSGDEPETAGGGKTCEG